MAADVAFSVEVLLDASLTLADLERLVSLIHHPGDLMPGRVEHEGRLSALVEDDEVRIWIVVRTKNREIALA